ncbi:MAG: DUF2330 domain-containing protein, partial [Phycisphaerae bacterium]|nr:DUF2330 domain-containing protein [Phycisphaerae bacterium]
GGLSLAVAIAPGVLADGKVFRPVAYKGSLEEKAQEAIIIFQPGTEGRSAREDLILKIQVAGRVKDFAWVVPLPNPPKTGREDARLFQELHRYTKQRLAASRKSGKTKSEGLAKAGADTAPQSVQVISRQVVGSYDVTVVREKVAGSLNTWLADNGYQGVEGADDVIDFYRRKNYVFACMKVTDAASAAGTDRIDLHPLRFSFETGGRDGIFFPMRLTGLQEDRFDVNLYVFYDKWINDRLSRYGYAHRSFRLHWRDYDGPRCKPNAGKSWSDPKGDPYLAAYARQIPTVTRLFQKLHPGNRYYMTNIQARALDPKDVRQWRDDLWMFPYYTDRRFVPHDARPGGPAAIGYR